MCKFGVVIQGRAISQVHLKKVVESYVKVKASKIVVSVYPEFIHPDLSGIENVEVVPVTLNDYETKVCKNTRVTFNYQIITTNRGLQQLHGVDFVFRTRADMLYTNLESRINKWVEKIKKYEYGDEGIFRSKIVWWKELPKAHIVTDFWQFGYLSDIKKLYDIPLVDFKKFKSGKVSETTITCGYIRKFFHKPPLKKLHPDATLDNNLMVGDDFNWFKIRDKYFLFDSFLTGQGKHTLTPYGASKGWKQYDNIRKEWIAKDTVVDGFNMGNAYIKE